MSHTSQADLAKNLNKAKEKVEIGKQYYHYKQPDMYYTLVDVCILKETEELAVVYRAEYGENLTWVGPMKDFLLEVEINGVKQTKFTLV